jgi:hypothetical protein
MLNVFERPWQYAAVGVSVISTSTFSKVVLVGFFTWKLPVYTSKLPTVSCENPVGSRLLTVISWFRAGETHPERKRIRKIITSIRPGRFMEVRSDVSFLSSHILCQPGLPV